ncbi:MAG: ankyrin repeat domain-containing protein [Alphaproteobacteria bacterium]
MTDDANKAEDLGPVTGVDVPLRRPLAFNRAAVPDAATVTVEEITVKAKRHRRTLDFFAAAELPTPDTANMRRLVSQGIDIDWREEGQSPLHVALRLNNPQLLKDLLEKGANARQRTREGMTPLSLAIDLGLGVPAAMLLVQAGADVNETSHQPADPALEKYTKEAEFWPGTRRTAAGQSAPIHDALRKKDTALAIYLAAQGAKADMLSTGGYAPLHILLEQKEIAAAKYLLGSGTDASFKTARGITPLSIAIDSGLGIEGVKLLLENGADIAATSASYSWEGFSEGKWSGTGRRGGVDHDAVQDALRAQDIDLAKFLIENGAPVNGASGDGSTPLVIALQNKNIPFATWLLDHGADPNACGAGDRANLPLQAAMSYHDTPVMQMLLDRGAKLDAQDPNGDTPLHHAVACSCTKHVSWLVDKGANLYLKNIYGNTPLLSAITGHNSLLDCADVLIARDPDLMKHWNDGKHAIHHAAKTYDGERAVIRLLQYGVPARLEDKNGNTPLYHAAHEGNGTAEALIYAGALKGASEAEIEQYKKMRTKGREGYAYWHWNIPAMISRARSKSEKLEKTAVAVRRKENAMLPEIDRRMFMMLQKSGSYGDYAADLVKQGANLNARNDAGQTPLIFACMNVKSDEVCEYLAKHSDLLAEDDNGMTALHYAVQHVSMGATVKYLVDYGADVDAQDKIYGRTALMNALKGGDYVEFLLKRDADIGLKDKTGLTARQLAHLHRNEYSEADLAKVEKAAKTKPRRKREKPRRYTEDRYGSYRGYRPGFW